MQTLIEKMYTQREGVNGLDRMLGLDEISTPASFPGAGKETPMNFPGEEIPSEMPLEIRLGYQRLPNLYVMCSFGVNDKVTTIGNWFEPLAGATLGPYKEPNYRKTGMDFDGGMTFYPKPNTGIFIENVGYGYKNLYSFHDRGPGRVEEIF